MNSDVSRALDSKYNRMQWAGEEYLLEEVVDNAGNKVSVGGEVFSKDVLYWIGYIYRYWHYYSGEDSKKIYKQAPVEVMKRNYMMFHTMDPVLAIEDLKKIYNQKIRETRTDWSWIELNFRQYVFYLYEQREKGI